MFDFRAFTIGLVALGVTALAISAFVPPAKAFYGSMAKDGNPVWECYDHPENCR